MTSSSERMSAEDREQQATAPRAFRWFAAPPSKSQGWGSSPPVPGQCTQPIIARNLSVHATHQCTQPISARNPPVSSEQILGRKGCDRVVRRTRLYTDGIVGYFKVRVLEQHTLASIQINAVCVWGVCIWVRAGGWLRVRPPLGACVYAQIHMHGTRSATVSTGGWRAHTHAHTRTRARTLVHSQSSQETSIDNHSAAHSLQPQPTPTYNPVTWTSSHHPRCRFQSGGSLVVKFTMLTCETLEKKRF